MWKDARDVNISLDELKTNIRSVVEALRDKDVSLEGIDIPDKFDELKKLVSEISKIQLKSDNTSQYANYVSDVFLKISDDVLRETSRKFKRIEKTDKLIADYKTKLLAGAKETNNILKELNEVYGDYNYFNNLTTNLKSILKSIAEYEDVFKGFHKTVVFMNGDRVNDDISELNTNIKMLKDKVNKALSFRKQLKLVLMNLKITDSDEKKREVLIENLEGIIANMNYENDSIHDFISSFKDIIPEDSLKTKQDNLHQIIKQFEMFSKELRSIDTIVYDFWERIENLSNISFDKRISLGDLSVEYEDTISELKDESSEFFNIKDKKVKMILEKLNVLIDDAKLNFGSKSPVNPVYMIGDNYYNGLIKDLFTRIEDLEDLIIQDKYSLVRSNLKAVTDTFNSLIQYENKKFNSVQSTESEMLINRNREFIDELDGLYNEEDYKNIDLLHLVMEFKRKFKRHLINEDIEMWD